MRIIKQYSGLRRENYILFFGRIVTNLGSMIWPVLTLILTQKMNFTATQASLVMIAAGLVLAPAGFLGGKLADHHNKKFLIINCDVISIIAYILCGFLPLSTITIILVIIAAACQNIEHPAYNALIADITLTKDRERAYSLQYLGSNIGLVASPIIAGFLFKDFLWLSFVLSGVAIGLSTILIYFMVQNIEPVQESEEKQVYQKSSHDKGLYHILKENRVVTFYLIIQAFYVGAYMMYGYLMPMDMGRVHGEDGAVIYGSVSSLNCVVVVLLTPVFTGLFRKMALTKKILLGNVCVMLGYGVFLGMIGKIPAYYLAITLFTFGEIFSTLANGPYLTERIPASHRGRVNGVMSVVQSVMQCVCLVGVGIFYDKVGSTVAWIFVLSIVAAAILGSAALVVLDKIHYKELYK